MKYYDPPEMCVYRTLDQRIAAYTSVLHQHIDKYLQSIHGFDAWPWLEEFNMWHVYHNHFERLCSFSREELYMWANEQYIVAKPELHWLLWIIHLKPVEAKGFDCRCPQVAEGIKIAFNSRVADMDAAHRLHLNKVRKERTYYENILG